MNVSKLIMGLCLSTSLLSINACASKSFNLESRETIAQNIAQQGNLKHHLITTDQFTLTTYQRISNSNTQTFRIYIEGDGFAWLSRTRPSLDPTPKNPIGLKLAAQDNSENVIYLARPCQYSKKDLNNNCSVKYWTGSRYAPEILTSYNNALDYLKTKYNIKHFELIGFSGGGTIAAILAGQRNDIHNLRTVAGNLNHQEHSKHHNVSYLHASLNPIDYADKLKNIPQYHFIGAKDEIVPFNIFQSYQATLKQSYCVNYKTIPNATHTEGWTKKWQGLVSQSVSCKNI